MASNNSFFDSQSVTEKYEKPLLRLIHRLQAVVFLYLKRVITDKRTRSLYDLDNNSIVEVVNFTSVQRILKDLKFYVDSKVRISLSKVEEVQMSTEPDASSASLESGNVIEIKRVNWKLYEQRAIAAIMRMRLPEIAHNPELLNALDRDELTSTHARIYKSILESEPMRGVCLEIAREREYFERDEALLFGREKAKLFKSVLDDQPKVSGSWRKTQGEHRKYDVLTQYAVTSTIPESEQLEVLQQLKTPLQTGFRGPAYNFDDGQLTEEWMCSFKDKNQVGPTDEDIIKVLTHQSLEILLGRIEDKVCTELKILDSDPLNLYPSLCCEQLVWGIDCACRKLIEMSIKLRVTQEECDLHEALKTFIERRLLPAINAQKVDQANNMLTVAIYMTAMPVMTSVDHNRQIDMKNCTSGAQFQVHYTSLEHRFSQALLQAVQELGVDLFRIHPKGTGVVCTAPNGIRPHQVVCEYLGELYPPYRWCERIDVLKQAQRQFHLKPTLPDFYNILLERPRQDPNGYGLLFVDAAQRSNIGSTLAHSCDNNCTSAVVSRQEQLTIVLTSSRFIAPGEEITHDYGAVTASEEEWRASVCLCGMTQCRGQFLHFSDEEPVQRILEQHCSPLWRYSALLKACSSKSLAQKDTEVLDRHGIHDIALGLMGHEDSNPQCKLWMQRFAADILRFIEHERAALPCALLRNQADFISTFASADWDARTVMEQRIQSLCCAFSMVQRVVQNQPNNQSPILSNTRKAQKGSMPLEAVDASQAAEHVWTMLTEIPKLISNFAQEQANRHVQISNSEEDISSSAPSAKQAASKRLRKAAKDISCAIKSKPPLSHQVAKDQCIAVRRILQGVQDLGDRTHRLRLLADVLAMWANTTYFSRPKQFSHVLGNPMTIFARELGNNVPRAHVEKYSSSDKSLDSIHRKSKGNCKPNAIANRSITQSDKTTKSLEKVPTIDAVSTSEFVKPLSKNLHADEPVFDGRKEYDSNFVFWQLMQWFHAGSEKDVCPVDIFGSVQLPEPHQCFGPCEGQYGEKSRKAFYHILRDEKTQALPWPPWLKACFSKPFIKSSTNAEIRNKKRDSNKVADNGETTVPFYETHLICGSPMLDVSLGLTHAVRGLMREILPNEVLSTALNKKRKKKESDDSDEECLQIDDTLPPEDNTSWVQCDLCHSWRRLPWNVDANDIGDGWHCTLNTWDKDKASCDIAADSWDPSSEDITETTGGEGNESLAVGASRDVFCLIDDIYYEGIIIRVKSPGAPADNKRERTKNCRGDSSGGEFGSVLFKFKFFGNMFQEWLPCNSGRIKPLHMFSDATATSLQQAQEYQGLYIKKAPPKKKKKSASKQPFTGMKACTSFSADGSKKIVLRELFK